MPEGPEIRLSADAIGKVLQDQVLQKVDIGLSSLKAHHGDIAHQKVLRVTSWGKAMLIHLENAMSIYSHNQLYGIWHVGPRDELPDTNRSLRLGLHTKYHSAVLYSASDISVWPTQRLCEQPLLSKLGPDVLSDELSPEILLERLKSPRFERKKLSRLYLDQHFVAGIGNYLRSEILFHAGLHPDLTPRELSQGQLVRLSKVSIDIAMRSYKTQGYTVDRDLWQKAIAQGADFEESRFMVFDRAEKPCRVCITPIQRLERNGRRLYWCPVCQPAVAKE